MQRGLTLKAIFEKCTPRIASALLKTEYRSGETMMKQGERHAFVGLLAKGRAKVQHTTEMGGSLYVYTYREWELFGEIEVYHHRESLCSIVALTDALVYRIPETVFLEWMREDFDFTLYVLDQLTDKMFQYHNLSFVNVAYPLEYRFLYFVLRHADPRHGALQQTKEQISETLGTNVRSLNRIIAASDQKGILTYKNGLVHVRSKEKLLAEIERYHVR